MVSTYNFEFCLCHTIAKTMQNTFLQVHFVA